MMQAKRARLSASGRRQLSPTARVAALALAGMVAGCTPMTPRLSVRSPLTIDFVWASPKTRVNPLAVPRRVPKAVVVQWNARDYSLAQIRSVATQQCLAYDLVAQPLAVPKGSATHRVERFACVIAVASRGGATGG